MIVDDLNVFGTDGCPSEADPALLVDSHAMLTFAIAFERFEPVPRGRTQVIQCFRRIELIQLASRNRPESARTGRSRPPGVHSVVDVFRALVGYRLASYAAMIL
jgi:hypothetical protein